MATFEGTLDEFYSIIGPRTSDLVTKIARPYRKGKSCRELKEDNKPCGKWRYLDAAHLKGRGRKILIHEILEENGKKLGNGKYQIDLNAFEKSFEEKHKSFEDTIRFMCRKHHVTYDRNNKISTDNNDLVTIESEEIVFEKELTEKVNAKELKGKLMSEHAYLNNGDCSIASLHHDNWNFNLNKSSNSGYLLCLNQFDRSVVILAYDFKGLNVEVNLKKDKKKISLNIPYNELGFVENKLGDVFTIKDVIGIE